MSKPAIPKNLLKDNPITILDLGAAGGIHKRWNSYKTVIRSILFEANKEEYMKLISNKQESTIVINSVLADKCKMVNFNICEKQQVSSTYVPNVSLLKMYEESERFKINKTIRMEANSINNLLPDNGIKEVDFIKIDTQGSELDILKGATNYFENLIGLEVEIEFVELYLDQPLFPEVHSFIESKGFSLIDLRKYYWKRKNNRSSYNKGNLIFADALYLKSPESLIKMIGVNQEKIIKSIYIYLAYGYFDLARSLLLLSTKNNLLSDKLSHQMEKIIDTYEGGFLLPNFKGKERIKDFFYFFGNKFSSKVFYSGSDSKLGN